MKLKQLFQHPLIRALILGALTLLTLHYLSTQWAKLRSYSLDFDLTLFVLAQAGFVLGILLLPLATWHMARSLGAAVRPGEVWYAFNLGMVAKYLPGSVWSLPSRAILYRNLGISQHFELIYWETALMVVAATLVSLTALPLLGQLKLAWLLIGVVLLSSTVFLLLGWGLHREPIPLLAARLKLRFKLPISATLNAVAIYMLVWVVLGLSFMALVYMLAASWNFYTVGLFALAWALGFLSVLTPGGVGVRDGILVGGLSLFIGDPVPFVAAVLARICWTVAELIALLLAAYYNKFHETDHPDSLLQ